MSILMKQSYRDIKKTNRCCCNATLLIYITLFLLICNYAKAQGSIEMYFTLETSNLDNKFNKRITRFIEQKLRDVENKPNIQPRCITRQDCKTHGKATSFLEYAEGEKIPYAVIIELIRHGDDRTISIRFELININTKQSYIWKEVVDISFSQIDEGKIEIKLNKIIGIIRGKPYKIVFTYCFNYSGGNEEFINLKNIMPKCLTQALKEILKNKNLDKVYEVIAIPVDCDNKQDRQRYQRENYDYSIAGTLFAKEDGLLKVKLDVQRESEPILDISQFESSLETEEGNVIRKLANFIMEQWPSITKGGQ